jgi:hypothetical protein
MRSEQVGSLKNIAESDRKLRRTVPSGERQQVPAVLRGSVHYATITAVEESGGGTAYSIALLDESKNATEVTYTRVRTFPGNVALTEGANVVVRFSGPDYQPEIVVTSGGATGNIGGSGAYWLGFVDE